MSCLSRHLVKDYSQTNGDTEPLRLPDRYFLRVSHANQSRANRVRPFAGSGLQFNGTNTLGVEAKRSSPQINVAGVSEPERMNSGKRISMAADLYHFVQPLSLPRSIGTQAMAPVRALAPHAKSLRVASPRRRVHGHCDYCPCREVEPLNSKQPYNRVHRHGQKNHYDDDWR